MYITIGLAWTAIFLFLIESIKSDPSPEAHRALESINQVIRDVGWFGLVFMSIMLWPFLLFVSVLGAVSRLMK